VYNTGACVCDEVPAAIAECQRAGITVRLVTGDALSTAKFVAYKCGILRSVDDDDSSELALDSRRFNELIRARPGRPVSYRRSPVVP